MRKARINVSFGGGSDTIVFSVKEGRFYSYEKDREELHNRYGGEQYYFSCSGLSGAGFLEPKPEENDLIVFGWYRTDAGTGHQHREIVFESDGYKIFGYAPIASHGGITEGHPFVLTDGRKVAFVSQHDVQETLLGWEKVEGKQIEISYFNHYGNESKPIFYLHNPNRFQGIRVTRFVDLRGARAETGELHPGHTVFEQKLFIAEHSDNDWWFHRHIDGYFDVMWKEDPRDIEGEIVSGWHGAGDGLYWRRGRNGVEAFMERERAAFAEGKYVIPGETEYWLDYEQNFSVLEWYGRTLEDWKEHFRTQCLKKARQDYVYVKTRAGIDTLRLMEQNTDKRICVQDSLDVGNCRPGTDDFIKRYGLKPDTDGCCNIGDLLENKSIEEMLRNFNFLKVIHHKLVDADREIPTLKEAPEAHPLGVRTMSFGEILAVDSGPIVEIIRRSSEN